jgi:hypothetical protein
VCVSHTTIPGDVFKNPEPVAICLKATSNVSIYKNNKELMSGVVHYEPGELSFFPLETVIQPDNLHPIPHIHLKRCHADGTFIELGDMPASFHEQITKAIVSSVTISPARRKSILQQIA